MSTAASAVVAPNPVLHYPDRNADVPDGDKPDERESPAPSSCAWGRWSLEDVVPAVVPLFPEGTTWAQTCLGSWRAQGRCTGRRGWAAGPSQRHGCLREAKGSFPTDFQRAAEQAKPALRGSSLVGVQRLVSCAAYAVCASFPRLRTAVNQGHPGPKGSASSLETFDCSAQPSPQVWGCQGPDTILQTHHTCPCLLSGGPSHVLVTRHAHCSRGSGGACQTETRVHALPTVSASRRPVPLRLHVQRHSWLLWK